MESEFLRVFLLVITWLLYLISYPLAWYETKFGVRVPAARPLILRSNLGFSIIFSIRWISFAGMWYSYGFAGAFMAVIVYYFFTNLLTAYYVRQAVNELIPFLRNNCEPSIPEYQNLTEAEKNEFFRPQAQRMVEGFLRE